MSFEGHTDVSSVLAMVEKAAAAINAAYDPLAGEEGGKRKRGDEGDEHADAAKRLNAEGEGANLIQNGGFGGLAPHTSASLGYGNTASTVQDLYGAAGPAAGQAHSDVIPPGQIREIIECTQDKVGGLIGTRGTVIQEMQNRSSCKIYIEQNMPEGEPRKVVMTGTPSAVAAARTLVNLVLEQGPQAIHMTNGAIVTQSMDCPPHLVGRVIGSQGSTIRELQARCGAKIQIDQNFPEGEPRKIIITGNPESVNSAIQMLNHVMENGPTAAIMTMGPGAQPVYGAGGSVPPTASSVVPGMGTPTPDGQGMVYPPTILANGNQHQIIECTRPLVGRIIGRGGETINIIQQKSGCRVQIDQNVPEGTPCKVNIQGPAQAVQLAAQLVQEVMANGPAKLTVMPSLNSGGYQQPAMQQQGGYFGPQAGASPYGAQPAQQYGYQPQPGYAAYQPQQQMPSYAPQASTYGQQAYQQPQQQPQMMQQYQQQQSYAPPQAYAPAAAPARPAQVPGVWSEHKTEDGNTYWYNVQTGVSQWEKPVGF